ncbi:hypothetical protein IF2G_01496 [Cordyceps javanica]|nr:hypothetical protein IF2G_01496 [Cordyceps javanica]
MAVWLGMVMVMMPTVGSGRLAVSSWQLAAITRRLLQVINMQFEYTLLFCLPGPSARPFVRLVVAVCFTPVAFSCRLLPRSNPAKLSQTTHHHEAQQDTTTSEFPRPTRPQAGALPSSLALFLSFSPSTYSFASSVRDHLRKRLTGARRGDMAIKGRPCQRQGGWNGGKAKRKKKVKKK